MFLHAALRFNLMRIKAVCCYETMCCFIQASMPYNLFIFSSRFISFDEKSEQAEKWENDKLN